MLPVIPLPKTEDLLHKIVALAMLAVHVGVPPSTPSVEGSYVAVTLNGRQLPADLRVPTTQGDYRLVRLEQGVLRLSSGGKFVLYFRYYHQLVRRGTRPLATPVLSESETGTYSLKNGQLILFAARKKNQSPPRIVATISGAEIRASYLLENGDAPQRFALVLRRDERYW